MTCYIVNRPQPTRANYQAWLEMGYQGDFEQYLRTMAESDYDGPMFICGDLGPHCTGCAAPGDLLCDYPVGNGKTCDRPICAEHSHHIFADIDYCNDHFAEWEAFRKTSLPAALAASLPLPNLDLGSPAND